MGGWVGGWVIQILFTVNAMKAHLSDRLFSKSAFKRETVFFIPRTTGIAVSASSVLCWYGEPAGSSTPVGEGSMDSCGTSAVAAYAFAPSVAASPGCSQLTCGLAG